MNSPCQWFVASVQYTVQHLSFKQCVAVFRVQPRHYTVCCTLCSVWAVCTTHCVVSREQQCSSVPPSPLCFPLILQQAPPNPLTTPLCKWILCVHTQGKGAQTLQCTSLLYLHVHKRCAAALQKQNFECTPKLCAHTQHISSMCSSVNKTFCRVVQLLLQP